MKEMRFLLEKHFQKYATIYVFMVILLITGVIFGAIIVNSMSFVQKQNLIFTLERFFGQLIEDEQAANSFIFKDGYLYHLKFLLLLFIAGLSVIGLPLVWGLLFIKGLVVGFSVGFIVNQFGIQGFWLAVLAIAPQNIFILPLYIVAGSLAMIFSLTLLGKLFSHAISKPIIKPLLRYSTLFLGLLFLAMIPAFIETFFAHQTMQVLIEEFSF